MLGFNHAFTVAFEVFSEEENPHNVNEEKVLQGLERKVAYFKEHPENIHKMCECFDTYEVTASCKFCHNPIKHLEYSHLHQGEHVCENCWDPRLQMTE